MSASAHLRRYAAFSPISKTEYRATMAEEGELLRAHGYALAPPMPFEAVGVWIDAGMPSVDDVEEPMQPLVAAFDAAIEAAASWREEAVGGALTVDAILAGEEGQGLPLGRWVETVLGAMRREDETLEILPCGCACGSCSRWRTRRSPRRRAARRGQPARGHAGTGHRGRRVGRPRAPAPQ